MLGYHLYATIGLEKSYYEQITMLKLQHYKTYLSLLGLEIIVDFQ